MLKTRVIPCLLLAKQRLVKTIQFKNPNYVGDPINVVRIFNSKEVDEIIILDIKKTLQGEKPDYKLISEIASECFMPLTYGGGITTLSEVKQLFALGIEKIAINSAQITHPYLIREIAQCFGTQSIIASIDVKKNWFGNYQIYTRSGTQKTSLNLQDHIQWLINEGVGEILLTSIHSDGTMQGYDLELIKTVTEKVSIPVIACGGAGKLIDFKDAILAGAQAVAAGSMVVYQGPQRAVLTCFPKREELALLLT